MYDTYTFLVKDYDTMYERCVTEKLSVSEFNKENNGRICFYVSKYNTDYIISPKLFYVDNIKGSCVIIKEQREWNCNGYYAITKVPVKENIDIFKTIEEAQSELYKRRKSIKCKFYYIPDKVLNDYKIYRIYAIYDEGEKGVFYIKSSNWEQAKEKFAEKVNWVKILKIEETGMRAEDIDLDKFIVM